MSISATDQLSSENKGQIALLQRKFLEVLEKMSVFEGSFVGQVSTEMFLRHILSLQHFLLVLYLSLNNSSSRIWIVSTAILLDVFQRSSIE